MVVMVAHYFNQVAASKRAPLLLIYTMNGRFWALSSILDYFLIARCYLETPCLNCHQSNWIIGNAGVTL